MVSYSKNHKVRISCSKNLPTEKPGVMSWFCWDIVFFTVGVFFHHKNNLFSTSNLPKLLYMFNSVFYCLSNHKCRSLERQNKCISFFGKSNLSFIHSFIYLYIWTKILTTWSILKTSKLIKHTSHTGTKHHMCSSTVFLNTWTYLCNSNTSAENTLYYPGYGWRADEPLFAEHVEVAMYVF